MKHYDCIIIGAGTMGIAACSFLAARRVNVLALDQFNIPHERGSHAGQSRIIRKAYFEHPDYVPLLERSYQNWARLESRVGQQLYHETGIVYFGHTHHPTMTGVRNAAELYNVPVVVDLSLNFPAFNIPSDWQTLSEPHAGFLTPEKILGAYKKIAIEDGAVVNENENVIRWQKNGNSITVFTDKHTYSCSKLIITSGSWTSTLLELTTRLHVTQQTLFWVKPANSEKYALGNLPCWFVEDPSLGMYYGFPFLDGEVFGGPTGMKIASHRPGLQADPRLGERSVPKSDIENLHEFIDQYFPGMDAEIVAAKTCLYTYSEDENFIIDHLPDSDKLVTIACGFSGHGFKFASAVGEILADLTMKGTTDLPIDFLRLSRFKS